MLDDTIVPKQKQFYGKFLTAERGVRQGDIVSPTIFNIVVDAVIRHAYNKVSELGDIDDIIMQFYADDGIIGGKNYERVQYMMDFISKAMISFGLVTNSLKTEVDGTEGAYQKKDYVGDII